MGYYTRYNLEARGNINKQIQQEITKALDDMDILNYALWDPGFEDIESLNWYSCDDVKWYEHQGQMKELSLKFPDITFELQGKGEEEDDYWREYYHDGMLEFCPGKVVYAEPETICWPPDPSKQQETCAEVADLI